MPNSRWPLALGLLVMVLLAGCGRLALEPAEVPTAERGFTECRPLLLADAIAIGNSSGHGSMEAAHSPEDVVIDQRTGMAYISVGNPFSKSRRGHLLALDLTRDPPSLMVLDVPRHPSDAGNFSPLGMSLLRDSEGLRLFVVNHSWRSRHELDPSILAFDIVDDARTGRPTSLSAIGAPIRGEWVLWPNDVAALDRHRVMFTNISQGRMGLAGLLDIRSGRNLGSVVLAELQDNGDALRRPVLEGFAYANGIAVSGNEGPGGGMRRLLHVSETLPGVIHSYEIATASDGRTELVPVARHALGAAVDNIDIDPATGDLLVAAHPSPVRFLVRGSLLRAGLPPGWTLVQSGSRVIRVQRPGTSAAASESVYDSDGGPLVDGRDSDIYGASVAAVYRPPNRQALVVIGSTLARKILVCKYQ